MKPIPLINIFGICIVAATLVSHSVEAQSGGPKKHYVNAITYGKTGNCAFALRELKTALNMEVSDRNKLNISSALRFAKDCDTGVISSEAASLTFQSIDAGNHSSWDTARKEAEQVTKLTPDYAPAFNQLGTIYARLAATGKGEHYINDAISVYKKALDLYPEYGIAHMNIGLAYGSKRMWNKSKYHLLKAKSLGMTVPQRIISFVERMAD